MERVIVMLAVILVSAAERQAPTPTPPSAPVFEVVSIKENKTVSGDGIISGTTPGRFTVTNLAVATVIRYAFRLRNYQLLNAPEWTGSIPYDVIATYPESAARPTDDQVRQMVQTLLADRFGLRIHRETRLLPVYELKLARADGRVGPQLVVSAINCSGQPSGPPNPECQAFQSRTLIRGRGRPIDALATALERMVGQRVLNRAGLTGLYDYSVTWGQSPEAASEATVDDISAMITALQDQLGLKLESTRARDEVVVVDSIRRPTLN